MNAWLVPTARATAWRPLAAVAAGLAVTVAAAAYAGEWPLGLLGTVAGVLAAAVVAGLRDPAEALLAAVPTSAGVRRARRLALLLPAGLALWLGYLASGQDPVPGLGWPVGPLAALVSTGLAVAVWSPARWALAAGAAAPLAWVALDRVLGAGGGAADDVLLAWQQHPWIVTVAASAALMVGRDR